MLSLKSIKEEYKERGSFDDRDVVEEYCRSKCVAKQWFSDNPLTFDECFERCVEEELNKLRELEEKHYPHEIRDDPVPI